MSYLKYYYCEKCKDYSTDPQSCEHERQFILSEKMRVNLSKFLSYIFRHNPKQIEIELDSQGFSKITVDELAQLLKTIRSSPWITRQVIEALICLDKKGRFEIRNDRFRARYGHSLNYITIEASDTELPAILYHGTTQEAYQLITREGLKPMGRNLVHLTSSIQDAKFVARRHKGKPLILEVDVKGALQGGIAIWQAGKTVFVSDFIPSNYLRVKTLKDD